MTERFALRFALRFAAALVLLSLFAGCQGQSLLSVRGVVVDVKSTSILKAESMTIRSEAGQTITFSLAPDIGPEWSPGHLRQHGLNGEPVTVFYQRTRDGLLAVKITD